MDFTQLATLELLSYHMAEQSFVVTPSTCLCGLIAYLTVTIEAITSRLATFIKARQRELHLSIVQDKIIPGTEVLETIQFAERVLCQTAFGLTSLQHRLAFSSLFSDFIIYSF